MGAMPMLVKDGTPLFVLVLEPDLVLAPEPATFDDLFLDPGKEKKDDFVAVGGVWGTAAAGGGGDTGGGVRGSVFQCCGGIVPMTELRFLIIGWGSAVDPCIESRL